MNKQRGTLFVVQKKRGNVKKSNTKGASKKGKKAKRQRWRSVYKVEGEDGGTLGGRLN